MKLDIQACDWFFINISDVPEYLYRWWQHKELHKGHFSKAWLPRRNEQNFEKKVDDIYILSRHLIEGFPLLWENYPYSSEYLWGFVNVAIPLYTGSSVCVFFLNVIFQQARTDWHLALSFLSSSLEVRSRKISGSS